MIHRSGQFLKILLLANLLAAGSWPALAAACPHGCQGCAMMATHAPCGSSQWTAAAACCSSQSPAPQPPAKVALQGPDLSVRHSVPLVPDRGPAQVFFHALAPSLRTARTSLFLLYADLLI